MRAGFLKYRDKEFGVRASKISSQSGVRAGVDGTAVGALAGACSERLVPCAGTGAGACNIADWSKQMSCPPSKA